MQFPPRTLIRAALAAGGMLLLAAVVYVGLGLVIYFRPWYASRILGEKRANRLAYSYEMAAGALAPGDRDSDGFSDGREVFQHSNPDNPADHPGLKIVPDLDGIDIIYWNKGEQTRRLDAVWMCPVKAQADERGRWRGRLASRGVFTRVSPGFQLRFKKPETLQLAPSGGPFVPADLVVPVAEDGSFAFDALFETPAGSPPEYHPTSFEIRIENAATHIKLNPIWMTFAWKLSPIIPTVIPRSPAEVAESSPVRGGLRGRTSYYELAWAEPPPATQGMAVETARDQAGAEWVPAYYLPPNVTGCVLQRRTDGVVKMYGGPIKFRIVPYRYTPPPAGGP